MRYYHPPIMGTILRTDKPADEWSIPKRTLLLGVPLFCLLFVMLAVLSYRVASGYLHSAYARNSLTRALAQAEHLRTQLEEGRNELLFLANSGFTQDAMAQYLKGQTRFGGLKYREVAFQGLTGQDRFILLNTGSDVVSIPVEQALSSKFGPFARPPQAGEQQPGSVRIMPPAEMLYPTVPVRGTVQSLGMHVIRMTTPVHGSTGDLRGYLTLSIDVVALRNTLSIYASPRSPLYIFPQESERNRGFFFDAAGWLLFQSESPDKPEAELSADGVRSGLHGDFGRPGYDTAFRPSPDHEPYWTMVTEVQEGRRGQASVDSSFNEPATTRRPMFMSYAPVTFKVSDEEAPVVYGGVGYLDTSFMVMASSYKLAGKLAAGVGFCALATVVAAYFFSRRISRPMLALAEAIDHHAVHQDSETIVLSPLPQEVARLRDAANLLLARLRDTLQQIDAREAQMQTTRQRQRVCLQSEIAAMTPEEEADRHMAGIVGTSTAVRNLRSLIRKAASIPADVLIIGETGTGKELTAEAIHTSSSRAEGPFISINCGALDENLLLDALFGHVKGAFSEAKGERKGAFLAADGGTLHLDEIGNASPKVQQALLRALSVRRIRPLGSDEELAFNARIVAATNVDLLECSRQGTFREDLYYRLAVITIKTPPLRERREDIPVLADYFLKQAAESLGRPQKGLARGALERLIRHDWPGNVREIKNCITGAVAFAETETIFAEDLRFGEDTTLLSRCEGAGMAVPASVQPAASVGGGDAVPLNGEKLSAAGVGTPVPMASHPAAAEFDPAAHDTPPNGVEDAVRAERDALRNGVGASARAASAGGQVVPPAGAELNVRQQKAWVVIVREQGITRTGYQSAVGGGISTRTAQYDLQDLIKKGLLVKVGRGPSSRYVIPGNGNV